MTVEKVKLSKRVMDAINNLYDMGRTNQEIIEDYLQEDDVISMNASVIKENMLFDTLLEVIVNGYEFEEEPIAITLSSDQVSTIKRVYATCEYLQGERHEGFRNGFRKALELAGIKIEGVNA